jgi:hypothetical protein
MKIKRTSGASNPTEQKTPPKRKVPVKQFIKHTEMVAGSRRADRLTHRMNPGVDEIREHLLSFGMTQRELSDLMT